MCSHQLFNNLEFWCQWTWCSCELDEANWELCWTDDTPESEERFHPLWIYYLFICGHRWREEPEKIMARMGGHCLNAVCGESSLKDWYILVRLFKLPFNIFQMSLSLTFSLLFLFPSSPLHDREDPAEAGAQSLFQLQAAVTVRGNVRRKDTMTFLELKLSFDSLLSRNTSV